MRGACQAWADYLSGTATIVLRVRLLGGEHTDLTYEDPDQDDEDDMAGWWRFTRAVWQASRCHREERSSRSAESARLLACT